MSRPDLALSDAALVTLTAYPWPGNIRELENVIHNAVLLAPGPKIEPSDLKLVREALRHRLNLLESGELGARVAGMLVSGLTIGQAAPRLVSSEGDDLGGPPRGKTMRGDMSQRC